METKVVKRALAFREFVAHARERLGLTLGFRLWDGFPVPADLTPGSLSIVIADENVVAALVYLAGCSIAFERGTVSIHRTLSTRRRRGPSGLPSTRADLYR